MAAPAASEAELPESCGGAVVVVDRLIYGIGIDLAGAVAVDRCRDVAEQFGQLRLVVGAHAFARGVSFGLGAHDQDGTVLQPEGHGARCPPTVTEARPTPEQAQDTYLHLAGYLAGLFAQRRAQPGDDLLTWLVQARDNDDRLTETELLFLGMALLVGGYETTAHQITNMVYTLLTHDEQLRQLKARPELLPEAVEEMLRFIVFGSALNPRIATADVKLGAVVARAGEPVLCSRSSANRDERVFPRAGELDITRDPNPHVAFGYGPHYCLGAHLARMELQVALGMIFSRLPGLHIAVPENELTWQTGIMMRGLAAFPVAW
jgi:cytochrome P450